MKKLVVAIALFASLLVASSCSKLGDDILNSFGANDSITNEEIIDGLKKALTLGVDTSVKRLSAVDGYFGDKVVKILLPPEAAPIFTNLAKIPGGQQLVDNTILAINRAAEDAAPEATSIFVDAITGITISDGKAILNGNDSAATTFLKKGTYSPLQTAFSPKITASLSKPLVLGTSAEDLYSSLVNTYNTASLGGTLFPKITQNTLGDYVTKKALDGLFHKVAVEEGKIRTDASHRIDQALEKVFGTKWL